jgi:hypothetical protein
MDEPSKKQEVKLNPNGASAAADRIIIAAAETVLFVLVQTSIADLSAAPAPLSDGFEFHFGSPYATSQERMQGYENWIVARGFQELARGVRAGLEEGVLLPQNL